MKKRVRIQDVAAKAGVSVTTVSRYLNERYEAMGVETRRRIAEVIDELGYRPNALAQGLKGNRTRIVAAIVLDMSYPFCVGIIKSLNHILSQSGYNLFVCETAGNPERERHIIESVQAQRVDAIVLQTDGKNNDLLDEIAKSIPVVFVDRPFDVQHAMNVITNNLDASYEMTQHLFGSGYDEVLYVTESELGIRTRADRLLGYRRACAEVDVQPWVITVDKSKPETYLDVVTALTQAQREDKEQSLRKSRAVYTGNGLLMMGLYPELKRLNLEVPKELGLATFDQPDWALLVEPSLTCVRQPIEEMGTRTGYKLLASFASQDANINPSKLEEIASVLVIGESTRRNPAGMVSQAKYDKVPENA